MQAHCLLHFSELAELTDCLALLSDADLYISRIFNTQFVSRPALVAHNVAHVKACNPYEATPRVHHRLSRPYHSWAAR